MAALTADELSRKAHDFIWTMERLLGAESGSLGGMIQLFDGLAETNGQSDGE
jgi:hypothetical protein